jgi:deazaflavin-dependent oxidoreductase (nitroreductase family)
MTDFNARIIKEFRSGGGTLGGPFAGAPLLLLTTTGAKTGKQRTNPLAYLPDGDRVVVFASKAGAPTNPDWYHNLLAHPDVTIEIDGETRPVRAVVVKGPERDELFARQKQAMPGFADYEAKTDRVIPVIALERR